MFERVRKVRGISNMNKKDLKAKLSMIIRSKNKFLLPTNQRENERVSRTKISNINAVKVNYCLDKI